MISKASKEKAESGDSEAMYDVAMQYFNEAIENRIGIEENNCLKFNDWLKNAIEDHSGDEKCPILGWAQKQIENGDFEVCLTLFKYLANRGNTTSQLILAYCYDSGYCGSIIDYNKAIYWYTQASNNGDEIAKKRLIEMGVFYCLP